MKRGVWQQDLDVSMRSCLLDNMAICASSDQRGLPRRGVFVEVSQLDDHFRGLLEQHEEWELEDDQRPGKYTPFHSPGANLNGGNLPQNHRGSNQSRR